MQGTVWVINRPAIIHELVDFAFETGFFYIALAVLEPTLQTRIALNSQKSTCLCLLRAAIKGLCHHTWLLTIPLIEVVLSAAGDLDHLIK